MCSTDFEEASVFNQTRVQRSRKPRNCYECSLPIPVGAPYVRTFMIYDRAPETYSVHVECDAISDFVRDEICRVEHEREEARKTRQQFRQAFRGVILLGGLDEELTNLRDYDWPLDADDAADACAMGFEVEDQEGLLIGKPADVAEWLWDVVRDSYRTEAWP